MYAGKSLFFFPESLSGEVHMRGVSCSSHTEADHTEDTQKDGGCVRVCVCEYVCVCVYVWEWCTTEGHRATPTHQSHNHTLTTNRGRKRKTSHGYIKYSLAFAQHTHTGMPPGWKVSAEVSVKFSLASITHNSSYRLRVKTAITVALNGRSTTWIITAGDLKKWSIIMK